MYVNCPQPALVSTSLFEVRSLLPATMAPPFSSPVTAVTDVVIAGVRPPSVSFLAGIAAG